jgi:DNA-binding response OmpR family regulator
MEDIMPPATWTLKEVSPQHTLIPQRKVLLVDQEARDRERYAQHLRERGLSVRACSSYEEGERFLERERYDLVVVDQGGPAFEGKIIAARSMVKDRTVPVLVITRFHSMACYIEAMQLGASDYLEKPIPVHEFLWRIGTHLPSRWDTVQQAN